MKRKYQKGIMTLAGLRSAFSRLARISVCLMLCLGTAFGSVPFSLAGQSAAGAEPLTAQRPYETYFSEQIATGDILNTVGIQQTAAPVGSETPLADYCVDMSVTMTYWSNEVKDGDTLTRNASVKLTLDFALQSSMQEETKNSDYTFTYKMPAGITLSGTTQWTPFFDGFGVHLMNWMSENNTIKIRFTDVFYSAARNNIKGFVTVQGVLNSSQILDGKVVYPFPQGDFTVYFPPAPEAFKGVTDNGVKSGDDLVWTFYISAKATDNFTRMQFSDSRGANIRYPMENVRVIGGGTHASPTSSAHVAVSHTKIDDNTYEITGHFAKNTYYFLLYSIRIPLTVALEGKLNTSVAESLRTNKATIAVTDKNGKTASASASRAISWSDENVVSVVKSLTGKPPDENGRITFTISITPRFSLDKLVLVEEPDPIFRKGVLTDVTNPSNPVVVATGAPYEFTLLNPVADKTYTFTFVADFPYEEAAQGLATPSKYNYAHVHWYKGAFQGLRTAYAYLSPITGKFQPPVKTLASSGSPIRISPEGDYLVDFKISVPAANITSSSCSAIFKDVYIEDTMGSFFTLLPETIKINGVAIAPDWLVYEGGNTFRLKLQSTFGTGGYTITYSAIVDRSALDGGLLNSNVTEALSVAARTNTAKLVWKAFEKSGETAESEYELTYDKEITDATLEKTHSTPNNYVLYSNSYLCYYTDFTITFTLASKMKRLVIDDVLGEMFLQEPHTGWSATVTQSDGSAYTGAYTASYNQFAFTDIPAGKYTITYTVRYAEGLNGLSYSQVLSDPLTRTNTATMTYENEAGDIKVLSASTVVPAFGITLTKTGAVQKNGDGSIKTTVLDGQLYAMVDWEIEVRGARGMLCHTGSITDTLFGRQFYAKNDDSAASRNSFLEWKSSYDGAYSFTNVSNWKKNPVGTEMYLQEFTATAGQANAETRNPNINAYRFTSYVRLPDGQTSITVANQVVYKNRVWGETVAIAEVTFDWDGIEGNEGGGGNWGGKPPVEVQKSLVGADTLVSASEVCATWRITIPASSQHVLKDAILTDYMNYRPPYSYFDLAKADISVRYADGEGAPGYRPPYLAEGEDGAGRLFLEFTEDLDRPVVITLKTLHGNVDFLDEARRFINFADLEYTLVEDGRTYYTVDQDYWSLGKTTLTKQALAPRFDEGLNQYVIDWTITLEDALRTGLETRIQDILPEGLWLVSGSVALDSGALLGVEPEEDNDFLIRFVPSQMTTEITFTTTIEDTYLNTAQSFVNRANLLVRDPAKTQIAAWATDRADVAAQRALQKSAELRYNAEQDRYEVTWAIFLRDATRRSVAYLNERLPANVTYVADSITVSPNRLNYAELSEDGRNLLIVLDSAGSSEARIQFVTAINDEELTQSAQVVAFRNFVDLLGSVNRDDVVFTAEAICNIIGGVRTFTKAGFAHYNAAEEKFLVDWTIVLDEEARAGREVTLLDTLPEGLILGSVTAVDGGSGEPVSVEVGKNWAEDGFFDLVFTPKSARTVITVRTYLEDDVDAAPSGSAWSLLNFVHLLSADGSRPIDYAEDTVSFGDNKSLTKALHSEFYDEELGAYIWRWKVVLTAPLAVGRALTLVEDPSWNSLMIPAAANAVFCGDEVQPLALSYDYTDGGKKLAIHLTPSQAVTTLYVDTELPLKTLFGGSPVTPRNTVSVDELSLTASAQKSISSSTDLLEKSSVYNNDGVIHFTILANKRGYDIASGASQVSLEDTLHEALTFLPDTVQVFDGKTGAALPAENYRVQYDADTRKVTFVVPNRRYVKITFDTLLNGVPGASISLVNYVYLKGTTLHGKTTSRSYQVSATAGLGYNTDYVRIVKHNALDIRQKLAGAKFGVYRVDSPTQSTRIVVDGAPDATGADGVLCLPSADPDHGLAANTLYYVQELEAPAGYRLDTGKYYFVIPGEDKTEANQAVADIQAAYPGIQFSVSAAPQVVVDNWLEIESRVIIKKRTATTKNLIAGAELEIRDAKEGGNLIHKFTSGAVETVLDNLELEVGRTYWLVETKAPPMHELAEPVSFVLAPETIEYDGGSVEIAYAEVIMDDDPIEVKILKTDIHGNPLAGCYFYLSDPSVPGVLHEWLSGAEPYIFKMYEYDKMFSLREEVSQTNVPGYRPAYGYLWFEYRLEPDGEIALYTYLGTSAVPGKSLLKKADDLVVRFVNEPAFQIIKVDEEGEPLAGAEMQLFTGSLPVGTPRWTWITDGHPYVVPEDLPTGTYVIHESKAPEGYALAPDTVVNFVRNTALTQTITIVDKVDEGPELVDIKIEKIWNDGGDQDGYRPDALEVVLLGKVNGSVVLTRTATLVEDEGQEWKHTWTDLRQKDTSGNLIHYEVDETTVPEHYEKSVGGNAKDGFVITNTHEPEERGITITKEWQDNGDGAGHRTDSIQIQLLGKVDGETVYQKTISIGPGAGTDWTYTWPGLPVRDGATKKVIAYTLDELNVPEHYTKEVDGDAEDGFIVTNAHIPTARVTVVKVWEDNGNPEEAAARPAEIEARLTASVNGQPLEGLTRTITLSEANDWQHEWKYLPLEEGGQAITYRVDEVITPNDYSKSVTHTRNEFTITNTYKPGLISVSVTKVWEDNNDQDGYRPPSVEARLIVRLDGEEVDGLARTVTLSEDNEWAHTWEELPTRDDATQKTYTYEVDEVATPDDYGKSVTGDMENGFVITNTHQPETVDFEVQKVWADNGDALGIRPDKIVIALLAGPDEVERVELTGSGDIWTKRWEGLPKKANGIDIVYMAKEVGVPEGYVSSVPLATNVPFDPFVITNTLANTVIQKFGFVNDGVEVLGTVGLPGAEFQVWNQDKSERLLGDMTLVTDGDGAIQIGNALPPGEYVLVETKAPAGYHQAADVPFTVTGNDEPIVVYDRATFVLLRKVDKANPQESLVGAKLAIFDSEEETDPDKALYIFTTAETTVVITAEGREALGTYEYGAGAVALEGALEAGKTYYIRELEAPEGYRKGTWSFVVSPTEPYTLKMLEDRKIDIFFMSGYKVWDDLGATDIIHPDVIFDLYRNDDEENPIASQTLKHGEEWCEFGFVYYTDPDGVYYTYTMKERPVEGYHSEHGLTLNMTDLFTNTRTTVAVSKVTKDVSGASHLVEGAELEIWTVGGEPKRVAAFTSGSEAATDLIGVLTPGVEYELREVQPPAGFVQAQAVTFTFTGKTHSVELVNKPTLVAIQKINATGGLLPNASLKILDAEGKEVWSGVTSNETQVYSWNDLVLADIEALNPAHGTIVLVGLLEAGKSYTLVETNPPSGYNLADNVTIIPDDTGAVTGIIMVDPADEDAYEVKIHKNDQYGDPVLGARLRLTDTMRGEVYEWTTTDEPYVISLPASASAAYRLEEIITPEGYQQAADITFAVHKDAESVNVGIFMIDELLDRNVHGTKTWNTRGLEAKDVTIQLYQDGVPYEDEDGNEVFATIPAGEDAYAFLNLPAVDPIPDADGRVHKYEYTVKELPVEGFGSAQSGTDFINTATRLEITKVDEKGELLGGAVFGLYDETGALVGSTWNTADEGQNPKVFVGALTAGQTYTLKEISAPLGYEKAAERTITISEDGSEQLEVVTNTPREWQVTIRKVAMAGSAEELLPGAIMGLYADGENWRQSEPLVSWNTTTSNPKVFTELDPTKGYHVAEIAPPAGYLNPSDGEEFFFSVDDADENGEITLTLTNLQTMLLVDKLAGPHHLAGAVLEIRDASGTPVRRWTSDGSSHTVLGLTAGENYTLHEVKPPDGYATNPQALWFAVHTDGSLEALGEWPNTVTAIVTTPIPNPSAHEGYQNLGGQQQKLTMQNAQLDVSVEKRSALTASGLAGATLRLYKGAIADGNLVEEWISGDTPHKINEPLTAGATYLLVESLAPEGYQYASPVTLVISDTEEPQLFTMTDEPTHVEIEKLDGPDGRFVAGATLALLDNETKKTVEVWVTGAEAKAFTQTLIAGRSYTLTEISTPAGYYAADPITFTVNADGPTPKVVMIDTPVAVEVSKADEDGRLLGGAEMSLYFGPTATGSALESWNTADENPRLIQYPLVEGQTYTIRETSAPDGYFHAQNLTFTVAAQKNPDESVRSLQLTMTDFDTRVAIEKYDEQTGEPLSGARLSLFDSAGALVDSWVSDGTPRLLQGKLMAGATYILHETAAPAGFAVAAPVAFTVPARPDSGTAGVTVSGKGAPTYSVRMVNQHIYRFAKVDDETGLPLAGATLYIRDESGKAVTPEWMSGATPHEVKGTFKPGQAYYLVEKAAPEGYDLAEDVRFTVNSDGTLAQVTMRDKRTAAPTPTPTPTPTPAPTPTPDGGGETTLDLTVTKIWQDNNNATGERPDSITLHLFRKASAEAGYPSEPYMTATLSGAGNTWTYTFAGLPRTENGERYDYLVREASVPGYTASYSGNGRTITNQLGSLVATPIPTPTPAVGEGAVVSARRPVGVRFVDGQWMYIDEYDTPLGTIPLTGDDSYWLLWIAAVVIPMIGLGAAGMEIRRRGKRRKRARESASNRAS